MVAAGSPPPPPPPPSWQRGKRGAAAPRAPPATAARVQVTGATAAVTPLSLQCLIGTYERRRRRRQPPPPCHLLLRLLRLPFPPCWRGFTAAAASGALLHPFLTFLIGSCCPVPRAAWTAWAASPITLVGRDQGLGDRAPPCRLSAQPVCLPCPICRVSGVAVAACGGYPLCPPDSPGWQRQAAGGQLPIRHRPGNRQRRRPVPRDRDGGAHCPRDGVPAAVS